jgi:hypothetical protein
VHHRCGARFDRPENASYSYEDISVEAMTPRDVIPVLIELHLVGRKTLLYSPTHALIPKAIDGLVERFRVALAAEPEIMVAVGATHLLYKNEPLDPQNNILRELTQTLSTAHVALVTFRQGLDGPALMRWFAWLRDKDLSADARHRSIAGFHEAVPSIRITPVSFKSAVADSSGSASKTDTWTQLLDALMEAGLDDQGELSRPSLPAGDQPEQLAEFINQAAKQGGGRAGYEQLVLAHLQRLAGQTGDPEMSQGRPRPLPDDERRRLATLINHLDPPVRERLFKLAFAPGGMGPGALQEVLEDLSEPVLLEVLCQIQAQHGTISIPTLELLRKFVTLSREQPEVQSALKSTVDTMEVSDRQALYAELFQKKSEKNFYPEPYTKTIKGLSGAAPSGLQIPHAAVGDLIDPLNDAQIHGHFITVLGELLQNGTAEPHQDVLIDRLSVALTDPVVGRDPEMAFQAFEALRRYRPRNADDDRAHRARVAKTIGPIVGHLTKFDRARAAVIVEHLVAIGGAVVPPLLEALNGARDMILRKRLLEVLTKIGRPIAPAVVDQLKDDRWFIVRNMIFLLGEVKAVEALPKIRPFTAHAHEQVRLEAYRALGLLAPPDVVLEAVAPGVLDRDERVAACAISTLCQLPTPRIADRLWTLLQPGRGSAPEARKLKIIEALSRAADPASRALLGRLARHRRFVIFDSPRNAAVRKAARAALRRTEAGGGKDGHGRAA